MGNPALYINIHDFASGYDTSSLAASSNNSSSSSSGGGGGCGGGCGGGGGGCGLPWQPLLGSPKSRPSSS